MPVRGDIIVADSIPSWARLALGSNGKVLQSNGSDLVYSPYALTINGAATLNDWFDQSVKQAASPTFAAVTDTQKRNSIARAYLTSDQTGAVHNVWTKINLDSESFDVNGNFDVSNYRYVLPVSGYYHADWAVIFSCSGLVFLYIVSGLYVNGSQYSFGSQQRNITGQFNYSSSVGSTLFYGNIGEYVELYGLGETSDASTVTFKGGTFRTFLCVNLVST